MTVPIVPGSRPPDELAKRVTINFPFDSGDVDYLADGMFVEVGISFPFEIVEYTLTAAKNEPSDLEVKLMALTDRPNYDPTAFTEVSTGATRPTITSPALVDFATTPAAWTQKRFPKHTFLRAVIVGNTSTLRGATLVLACVRL